MSKKQHLSRLAAPKSWPIKRKGIKWVAKPTPGPHKLQDSMPLVVVLREILKVTKDSKEVKYLVRNKEILVNSRVVRDIKLSVGLFDIISLSKLKLHYRMVLSKNGKFRLIEIPEKESASVPLKVDNKVSLGKDKIQINFTNGWNLISKEKIKVGDSVLFNASTNKIDAKLPSDKGVTAYVTGGRHSGVVGNIADVQSIGEFKKRKIVSIAVSKDETIATDSSHIFIVGGAKAAIKVE